METQVDYLGQEVEALKAPHAKQASEFFNHLLKAVKARLVYPASSKLPEQFKNDLYLKASEIFKTIDKLGYKISSDTIQYGDHIVYQSSSRTENFAHVFFRDGIINIIFSATLDEEELERFINLIAKMMRTVYIDDDLATLLWEENFPSISYELIDDGLEIETIEYSADKLRSGKNSTTEDLQSLFIDEGEITFDDDDFATAGREMNLRRRGHAYASMPEATQDFLNRVAEFTNDDKDQILQIVNEDAKFDHTEYILTVIFEILGMEKELPGYTETMTFIGKVRDNLISLGNFAGAASLLDRMKEMHGVLVNLSSPRADKINAFFLECASNEKISLITETANNLKDIESEGLTRYLTHLPWAAIDPLIGALGDLKYFKARQTICNVLAELGRGQIDLVARGLEDERWYVVRNIVMVLGQIGDNRILNHLKKTIRHPDYRVRKETLAAAGSIRTGDNYDFMILALSDPDVKIQIASLQYLIDHKVTKAYKAIEHIIEDKKFKDRPPDQIKKFLESYAYLGQDKALALLKPLALKRSFLISTKDERLKYVAISVLGLINVPQATKLLSKLANNKNPKISSIAMKASSNPGRMA